jgi:hypothetical protein
MVVDLATISRFLKCLSLRRTQPVFTIHFASEDALNAFFANDEYLKIRQRHFEKSVTDTTTIATYGEVR